MTRPELRATAFTVRGIVQGVGFRWFVRDIATGAGVTGWVRNDPEGSVTGELFGPEVAVAAVIAKIQRGPSGASVTGIDIHELAVPEPVPFNFEIRK